MLTLRLSLFGFVLGLLLPVVELASQEAAKEYDLTWKLPHDRAAVYDVFDAAKGVKQGEFWLLGCELERRIGSTDFNDLPIRFLFRLPRKKMAAGAIWEIQEFAYGDMPVIHPGIEPVEISGAYHLMPSKKHRLEDIFKTAQRNKKDKSDPIDLVMIEGRFDLCRCGWVNGQVTKMEKTPSSSITVLLALRGTDGAILGGRYQFSGRNEMYEGKWSGPRVGRSSGEGREFVLREPYVAITKEGLKVQIDQAVERGVKWLKSQQVGDGSISDRGGYAVGTAQGIGATAMSLLAMLHSGVLTDDPAIRKGFAYVGSKKVNQSYDLALQLMAIEGKYLPMSMLDDIEKYSEDLAREEIAKRLSKEDKEAAEIAVRALLETQSESGLFGYVGGAGYPNLSSTQYAVLGLKSASRLGISISPMVWKRVVTYLETAKTSSSQDYTVNIERRSGDAEKRYSRTNGWGYISPKYPAPTGTMTCAALSTMAICESELTRAKAWTEKDAKPLEDQIWGGLAWLQEQYNLRAGTPEGCVYGSAMVLYYLYGLERALILLDVKTIGGHDWYLEGAATLLSWQQLDGRWEGPHGTPVIDTAYALLFLKRAMIPVKTMTRSSLSTDAPK
jgi:hypothetical protein